ncbi:hypothetical protein IFM89_008173 [Coptis chinensis]|uniref:Glycosyltransferase 61 catalytic domain-containing protein n=1 Tax=Coptis chinensis TaxID=261450 RepID=A0A835I340_9MAGN|nr:hypothetical protein IFM89_008173 [Coptis chinensis]
MMERLVKGLEAFDRKPPEKSVVQKVANAYEMLGLLEEKNRVLEKFNDLFTDTWRGHPKKSKKASGKKLEKPGIAYESKHKTTPLYVVRILAEVFISNRIKAIPSHYIPIFHPTPSLPFTMNNIVAELGKSNHKQPKQQFSGNSPKLHIYFLLICAIVFLLFQILALNTPTSLTPTPPSSWSFLQDINTYYNCSPQLNSMITKLRQAVTFLPLKDLRYSNTALQGHTWFMSSMYDKQEEGEVQYQYFPSQESQGRLLCIKGNDTHDGSWNSYALAWEDALPFNATLLEGLTFVSYNHYNYDNIWHGLSAVVPFVAWHKKTGCAMPTRWILYHWGEVRGGMGTWLTHLMKATFGEMNFETFDRISGPACFERAVVMRHNEGGMSRDRRLEVYDLLRCKARVYCNVSLEDRGADVNDKDVPKIGMTMFMRTGPRSFRNASVVTKIFESECSKVDGCGLMVAHSNNLSFCEQVNLMSSTDILVSAHGAQLTNMFLMDRNSSVMEFFPKGWLKLAGVGQYVYHWIASWSGMKHRGAWRDPNGEECPFPEDDRRCMSIYKGGMIGYNETYFTEWARNVLNDVKINKMEEASKRPEIKHQVKPSGCAC